MYDIVLCFVLILHLHYSISSFFNSLFKINASASVQPKAVSINTVSVQKPVLQIYLKVHFLELQHELLSKQM